MPIASAISCVPPARKACGRPPGLGIGGEAPARVGNGKGVAAELELALDRVVLVSELGELNFHRCRHIHSLWVFFFQRLHLRLDCGEGLFEVAIICQIGAVSFGILGDIGHRRYREGSRSKNQDSGES